MEYNTSRGRMILPEYGRNIQKMVDHATAIVDKEERNNAAMAIVDVMGQLNPHLRDVTDFKHKLWDHLFIISDFKIDVESPYPKPTPETLVVKPQHLRYPSNHIKLKHYGKTVELMIDKAKEMEEGHAKDAAVAAIANFMKMSYLNHNLDSVGDEQILSDLKMLSKGELKLNESYSLSQSNDLLNKKKPSESVNNGGNGKRNYKQQASSKQNNKNRKKK